MMMEVYALSNLVFILFLHENRLRSCERASCNLHSVHNVIIHGTTA